MVAFLVRDCEAEAAGEPFAIELVSEPLPMSTGREGMFAGPHNQPLHRWK